MNKNFALYHINTFLIKEKEPKLKIENNLFHFQPLGICYNIRNISYDIKNISNDSFVAFNFQFNKKFFFNINIAYQNKKKMK